MNFEKKKSERTPLTQRYFMEEFFYISEGHIEIFAVSRNGRLDLKRHHYHYFLNIYASTYSSVSKYEATHQYHISTEHNDTDAHQYHISTEHNDTDARQYHIQII